LCPHCKLVCKTNKDKDDSKKHGKLEKLGHLVLMYECIWNERLRELQTLKTSSFQGVLQKRSSEKELLEGIESGKLYGFLKCDILSSPEFISEKLHCNFPPLIRNMDIDESMLSPYMKSRCKNRKFPVHTLVQTYNGQDMLIFTPLLRFYIQMGLRVTNIQYFIQYEPYPCLRQFTQKVCEMRMAADYEKNAEKSVTAKLVGNRYGDKYNIYHSSMKIGIRL